MTLDKRMSMEEAATLVQNGQTLALGGMTIYRRPVAFVRALLRLNPRPQDLTLLAFTASYACDLLVGAVLIHCLSQFVVDSVVNFMCASDAGGCD